MRPEKRKRRNLLSSHWTVSNDIAQIQEYVTFTFRSYCRPFHLLPRHLSCSELGVPIASDYKFAKKVAQLNLNIIFLCLKIGMNPEQIQPTQSLHNLYQLFTELLLSKNAVVFNKTAYSNEELAEKLYELSISNVSYLDQLSPTNDDLLNDSDDDCTDYDKSQRVSWML